MVHWFDKLINVDCELASLLCCLAIYSTFQTSSVMNNFCYFFMPLLLQQTIKWIKLISILKLLHHKCYVHLYAVHKVKINHFLSLTPQVQYAVDTELESEILTQYQTHTSTCRSPRKIQPKIHRSHKIWNAWENWNGASTRNCFYFIFKTKL